MYLYIIVAAVALAAGFGGGVAVDRRLERVEIAQYEAETAQAKARVDELEAAAAATKAAGSVVEAAIADQLAKTALSASVVSTARAKLICEGPLADATACTSYLLCAQEAAGTVQASACDAAVNQWISERQLVIIESGSPDAKIRDERRRTFERRK